MLAIIMNRLYEISTQGKKIYERASTNCLVGILQFLYTLKLLKNEYY